MAGVRVEEKKSHDRKGSNSVAAGTGIDADVEEYFPSAICPITLQLFKEPVADREGHTYEKAAIIRFWAQPKVHPVTHQRVYTDPNTGLALTPSLKPNFLIPNFTLKKVMAECKEQLPKLKELASTKDELKKTQTALAKETQVKLRLRASIMQLRMERESIVSQLHEQAALLDLELKKAREQLASKDLELSYESKQSSALHKSLAEQR